MVIRTIKVWGEETSEVKMPVLALQSDVDGGYFNLELVAVDDNGEFLCILLDLVGSITKYSYAKEELEGLGYSTEWAFWSDKGEFNGLRRFK